MPRKNQTKTDKIEGADPATKRMDRERDDVLLAFDEQCPFPTAVDVRAWSKEHPDHADSILEHAVRMRSIASVLERNPVEPTAQELDEAWERHLKYAAELKRKRVRRPRERITGR